MEYMILGMRRSGTTVTHHCLRGHRDVSAVRREVRVRPFFFEGPDSILSKGPTEDKERFHEYRALFDGITRAGEYASGNGRLEESSAYGMKCAFGTPRDAEMIVETLQRYFSEVKVIYVIRRNAVAQFGSLQKAGRTDIWHQRGETKNESAVDLCVDPCNFARFAIDTLRIREIMSRLLETHDVLEISYENDILKADITSHSPLFEFVGVSPQDASWVEDRKLSPHPREYITNYKQIRELWSTIKSEYEAGEPVTKLRDKHEASGLQRLGKRALFWAQHPIRALTRLLRE